MFDLTGFNPSILIIDDEKEELTAYKFLLESMGLKDITTLDDSRNVLDTLEKLDSPVVFLDLNMPKKSGKEVLKEIKEHLPQVPVIICTANSDLETAVECLKLGAHDYLVKPISVSTFGSALRNASEIGSLRSELLSLKRIGTDTGLKNPENFKSLVTCSGIMTGIFQYIESIAKSGQPVLVLGETGAGKELIAKAIHDSSGLKGEFVAVDVSGLDDSLFSDTLFGHAKGAYTGADSTRPGLVERAAGGTIFLDEIGDLNETSQVKLLRLMQERIYYPLGSDKPKQCQARIIAATNKDLNAMTVAGGTFRRDLYYRLSTHLIKLPSLRERKEDIPLLTEYLAEEAAKGMDKPTPVFSLQAMRMLVGHDFPGNIRELKTYIYDAVARCNSDVMEDRFIAERLGELTREQAVQILSGEPLEQIFGHFPTLEEITQYAVTSAMKSANNNQSQAAKLLGISKQALNKRIQKRGH
ncbi:sigma-54-dependent transcriptional regulator [Sphaerochaeta sp.]|uniref:sigma-54-dependent transcriptional regulator n=1 Tax=Sphaerochaeta sp. TaxID=1972642 RepID=UPI003D0DD036